MIVNIYRRHSADCRYKADRYSKRCSCALWLQYQDRPQHTTRITAHTSDWEEAKKAAAKIERGERVTISDASIVSAVESYLAHLKTRGMSGGAMRGARTVLLEKKRGNNHKIEPLAEFAARRGVMLLADVTERLITDWKATWELKRMDNGDFSYGWRQAWANVRRFFRWACASEDIALAKDVTAGANVNTPIVCDTEDPEALSAAEF